MRWDGAENARAEVFRWAFGFEEQVGAYADDAENALVPAFLPRPDTEAGARIAGGRRAGLPDAADLIAVGVSARPGDLRQYVLTLVLQDPRLRDHPIVERARAIVGPAEIEILESGPVTPLAPLNAGLYRPLCVGASVSHVTVSAGSLGFFATCRGSGVRGIVSNNHVLAATNGGVPGDLIVQPGSVDGGGAGATRVARLDRFHPIDFSPYAANRVDGAFAALIDGVACEPNRIDDPLGVAPPLAIGNPLDVARARMAVVKVGRTTARTVGGVIATRVDNVAMVVAGHGIARFDRQVAIRGRRMRFSAPGDSGALVATKRGRPVGLLFSGTPSGITYANPIRDVLDLLNVTLHARP